MKRSNVATVIGILVIGGLALWLCDTLLANPPQCRSEAVENLSNSGYSDGDEVLPANLNCARTLSTSGGGFNYYGYLPGVPEGHCYPEHPAENSKADPPEVILIAGYPEPHYFDAVVKRLLKTNHRVLVLDLPGKAHRRLSDTPTAAFIVNQFQQLWDQNILNLQSARNFLIVGTSIGSPVAALMAARWHAQTPRLALVSALGMKRSWNEWRHPLFVNTGRIRVLSDLLAPFVLPWLTRDSWEHGEILRPRNFQQLFERQREEFTGPYAAINYLELTRALVLTDQTPVYNELNDTAVPVRLINGKSDPFCDQIEKLRAVLPKIQTDTIDDAAHIPFIEQPDQTVRLLTSFLAHAPF